MAESPEITPQDLGLTCEASPSVHSLDSLRAAHRRIEMELIIKAMSVHHGNLSRAAKELEVSRSTLYRKINEFRLEQFVYLTNPAHYTAPSLVKSLEGHTQ